MSTNSKQEQAFIEASNACPMARQLVEQQRVAQQLSAAAQSGEYGAELISASHSPQLQVTLPLSSVSSRRSHTSSTDKAGSRSDTVPCRVARSPAVKLALKEVEEAVTEAAEARLAAEVAKAEGAQRAVEAEHLLREVEKQVAWERAQGEAEAAKAKEDYRLCIEAARIELRAAQKSEQRLRETLLQQGAELTRALSEEAASREARDAAIRARSAVELELLDARNQLSSLRSRLREAEERAAQSFAVPFQERDLALQQVHRAKQALVAAQTDAHADAASRREIAVAHQKAKQALARQEAEAEEKAKAAEQEMKRVVIEYKERLATLRQTNQRLEVKLKKVAGISHDKIHEASTAQKALEMITDEFISHEAEVLFKPEVCDGVIRVLRIVQLRSAKERAEHAEAAAAQRASELYDTRAQLTAAAACKAALKIDRRVLQAELRTHDDVKMGELFEQQSEVAEMQVRFSQMQRDDAHLASRSSMLQRQAEAMLARIQEQGHMGAAGLQAESRLLRQRLVESQATNFAGNRARDDCTHAGA